MIKRRGIRFRLMILMICLTTLPVATVTWLASNNTRHSVEKEMINANNSRMEWANQYLNELIQQLDTLFYTVQIDTEFMGGLKEIDNSNLNVQYTSQKYIGDTLTKVFHANSHKIDDFTLYIHENKKAISVSYTSSGLISFLDIQQGPWSRMLATPTNIYFKQEVNGIYAFHSMNRFEDHKLLGGLAVKINRKVWDEVGSILKSEKDSSVFLINDEGQLLSGSNNEGELGDISALMQKLAVPDSGLGFQKLNDHYYFMQKVSNGKLTLVKAIPLATINRSAQATIKAGILTGGLFVIASIILSILFSLRISKPIVSLARTMRTAQIQSFELKSVNKTDEIGLLEHGYNSMMQRIKELIEVEYQREIDLKTAQLRMLQAQINPHFLNNTLHLIGGMALEKDAPEIYRVTRVIGELLRYSISTGNDLVAFADELKHMQNYIFIQEQRFAGRCQVLVANDEASYENRLPKFILQPIVENAFEHGLQRKEGQWSVEVRVKQIRNRLLIAVQDNGIGLGAEKLSDIRKGLRFGNEHNPSFSDKEQSGKRKGIGLKNVDTRLKLHFGEHCGIRIYSKQGEGTIVLFMLPIQTRGEPNHV
ncbi:sensor histidine kinase [Paenibacillus psychroresistens]|uniref:histidine kinase n=1 Tax=Paenibacillus psychroresistens TaxID=1778678 RepID=A0A6B8RF52_9BACL|nr:sensor histidine kinase [Paenibacillus psychroresistens]QGQ93986.1 sensor histidine kinase [Paenibacillus psychroresistens]